MKMWMHPRCWAFLGLAGLLLTAGCSTYQLRGKVVDGSGSAMRVVDQSNPQMQDIGIGGARVLAILDPDKPSRKTLPEVLTQPDGTFALPIDEPGAGFLEYEVLLSVRLPRMSPAVHSFPLPPAEKRVLVTLSPGRDMKPYEQRDIVEETRRLGEMLSR